MREPKQEQDFKRQLELLRTLMSRVTEDVQQIDIITNYLEDKLEKKRNANMKKREIFNFKTTRIRKSAGTRKILRNRTVF